MELALTMLKYIIIICLFLNGCTAYKHNQLQKQIIKKQQSWLNIQYLAMKMPQLTNKKGTMKIKCIKCNKKHDEQNMCLSINDIIENHVKEKTINDFEKNYLKGMSIENAFCGTCASQSLKIMEGKL